MFTKKLPLLIVLIISASCTFLSGNSANKVDSLEIRSNREIEKKNLIPENSRNLSRIEKKKIVKELLTSSKSDIPQKKFDLALQSLLEAYKIAQEISDKNLEAEALEFIGIVNFELKDKKCLDKWQKSLKIYEQLGNEFKILSIKNKIATYKLVYENDTDSSLEQFKSILKIARKKTHEDNYAELTNSLYHNIGLIHKINKDYQKAFFIYNKALNLKKDSNDLTGIFKIYMNIGNLFRVQNEYKDAILSYDQALKIAKETNNQHNLKLAYYAKYATYKKDNNSKKALENFEKSYEIYEKSIKEEKNKNIAKYNAEFENILNKKKILELESQNKIEKLKLEKIFIAFLLGIFLLIAAIIIIILTRIKSREHISFNKKLIKKNQELEKIQKDLKENIAEKNKLFSIIGHDIKNPLHIILNISDILSYKFTDLTKSKKVFYIKNIKNSASKLSNLLDDLMEWAAFQKIDNSGIHSKRKNISVLVNEIFELYNSTANDKEISLINDSDDLYIKTDPFIYKTIIRNLVNNAIKFTPEKGTVKISAFEKDNKIFTQVIDNGNGIPKNLIGKIFKLNKNTNAKGGLGIGLFLCKELVEKLSGELEVKSSKNGTTFSIILEKK